LALYAPRWIKRKGKDKVRKLSCGTCKYIKKELVNSFVGYYYFCTHPENAFYDKSELYFDYTKAFNLHGDCRKHSERLPSEGLNYSEKLLSNMRLSGDD